MVHLFVIVCASLCSNCALAHSPTSILPRREASLSSEQPSRVKSQTDFCARTVSVLKHTSACVTWLQGLPCPLVPQTFFFPHPLVFVVTKMNSRTCPIWRAATVPLPDRNPFVVQQLRPKALPASLPPQTLMRYVRTVRLYVVLSNGACTSCPWTSLRVLSRSACHLYHTLGDKVSHAINLCLFPRTVFISFALNGFP
jgi:hypothetical protein